MDFEIEHRFPNAAPDDVALAFSDLQFQRSLEDLEPLRERHVLDQNEDDGVIIRRIRCVLAIDLGKAKAFVGDADPAWTEEWRSDDSRRRWTWTIHPDVAKELLSASGTMELVDDGSDGTVRRIKGRVSVRVPLYGGRVEGWIADGLERAYDEEAERLQGWIDR